MIICDIFEWEFFLQIKKQKIRAADSQSDLKMFLEIWLKAYKLLYHYSQPESIENVVLSS